MFRFAVASVVVAGSLLGGMVCPMTGAEVDYPAAARGLVERVLPGAAGEFVFEVIPSADGKDVFELESVDGSLVVRGNNAVAMASGVNWYLKHVCDCQITWRSRQLDLPRPLPVVPEKVRVVSPHRYRYYFNYCCFSYTLAFWDWSEWERMIDLMAMYGVNAPLSVTGQEAVWQSAGRRLGLSDEQMQEFFVGPGFLPFGWMGCIDRWAGPLPQSWIDSHAELQKKIVARERAFGMTPILQGFTGHCPVGLKKAFPEAKIVKLTPWCRFDSTYFVDPNDPLFRKVGEIFIEEQTKLYGTDHLYASDTFIEMPPTNNDPAFLSAMGRAIHGSMTAADPEAIWVLQGWIFYNAKKFWKPPQYRAFLGSVPKGKLLLLDLICEAHPTWRTTEAFCGQPWVWCILQNFGGTVSLHGAIDRMADDLSDAMKKRGGESGELSGVGYIMEGLGWNPVIDEFQSDMVWRTDVPPVEEWLDAFVRRRYGQENDSARDAWRLLHESVYRKTHRQDPAFVKRPRLGMGGPPLQWKAADAWKRLLETSDTLGRLDTYRFDLTNVSRHVLGSLFTNYNAELNLAYKRKDREALQAAGEKMQRLLSDIDRILAADDEYLLGPWLARAKRWGANENERRLVEWNARTILTLWGPPEGVLDDYATRQWSGLVSDYYAKRWALFAEALDQSLAEEKPFDAAAFDKKIRNWQAAWAKETKSYPTKASGEDPIALSKAMYEKYKDELVFQPEMRSLTTGKPVSCSDALGQFPANLANDGRVGDTQSFWACDVGSKEGDSWWQCDFEKPTDVGRVLVVGYYGIHVTTDFS